LDAAANEHCYPSLNSLPTIPNCCQWHQFTIANADLDQDFDFYLADGLEQTVASQNQFNTGIPLVNQEQKDTADPHSSEFYSMQYQNYSGWHDWPNSKCWYDSTQDLGKWIVGSDAAHMRIGDSYPDTTCGGG
jgi:hypothetical protein